MSNPDDNFLEVVGSELSDFLRYFCINARDDFYTGLKLFNDGNKLLFGTHQWSNRKLSDAGILELETYKPKAGSKLAKGKVVLETKWRRLVQAAKAEILESVVARSPLEIRMARPTGSGAGLQPVRA